MNSASHQEDDQEDEDDDDKDEDKDGDFAFEVDNNGLSKASSLSRSSEVLKNGVRSAMKRAMPVSFFPRPMKNIQVVSQSLGIGYVEMLYL